LRAGRALTGSSQAEVAQAAGVFIPTLKRAEAGGTIKVAPDTIEAIAKALEKAGVEFIAENGGGGSAEEANQQALTFAGLVAGGAGRLRHLAI
jgi:transcriptional regulator with XRE-family HTH domain